MRRSGVSIAIVPAAPSDLATVRELFVEYAASLGFSLAYQDFEAELARLPGAYAPPAGALLLALVDDAARGVVALRPTGTSEICEMKRLFVRPATRGLQLGRSLAAAIVTEARRLGYQRMRLDTLTTMSAAIGLYRSMGFREIDAYYASPLVDTVFFELAL